MAACGEKDPFRADGLFAAIVKDDFDFVFREEVGSTVDVFNPVVLEVLLVDAVQSSDVSVALVLEGCEVKRRYLFDVKTVCLCFV